MGITEDCPELHYFKIAVKMLGTKKDVAPMIATFESSLGLKSLITMGFNDVMEIIPVVRNNAVNINFHYYGIYLAETSLYYKPNNIDGFMEDYFISKIAGFKQGTL